MEVMAGITQYIMVMRNYPVHGIAQDREIGGWSGNIIMHPKIQMPCDYAGRFQNTPRNSCQFFSKEGIEERQDSI
jgi:hypothetical protein